MFPSCARRHWFLDGPLSRRLEIWAFSGVSRQHQASKTPQAPNEAFVIFVSQLSGACGIQLVGSFVISNRTTSSSPCVGTESTVPLNAASDQRCTSSIPHFPRAENRDTSNPDCNRCLLAVRTRRSRLLGVGIVIAEQDSSRLPSRFKNLQSPPHSLPVVGLCQLRLKHPSITQVLRVRRSSGPDSITAWTGRSPSTRKKSRACRWRLPPRLRRAPYSKSSASPSQKRPLHSPLPAAALSPSSPAWTNRGRRVRQALKTCAQPAAFR